MEAVRIVEMPDRGGDEVDAGATASGRYTCPTGQPVRAQIRSTATCIAASITWAVFEAAATASISSRSRWRS